MTRDEPDYKRVFLAVFLAAILLIGWQIKVEWPRRQMLAHQHAEMQHQETARSLAHQEQAVGKEVEPEDNPALTRQERLAIAPRVTIRSDALHGSIDLQGARFDDLTLAKYRETLDPNSPEVTLLSPNGDPDAYFAQIGWVSPDKSTKLPDQHTLWQADKQTLGTGDTVTLRWDNGEGLTFVLEVTLDEHYMFRIAQKAENHSDHVVNVTPYAYVNRVYDVAADQSVKPDPALPYHYHTLEAVIHEGPVGVMDGALNEMHYKELRDKGTKTYDNTGNGWVGITDKYWLAALVPHEGHYKASFSHYAKGGHDRYQVDYLAEAQTIAPGASSVYDARLFAGAKEVRVLDQYAAGDATHGLPPIPLFDRAVDFGSLYMIAKPMFLLLDIFFRHIGNFGVAILCLTVVIRMLLYPLANKSYHAMAQMRELQPEMQKIRERYFDDQITLNKEMLALYKREKVNPASGCLPVLLQMPVFFALYKVLYVSIEMRHAAFFGWIKDLSAGDPSNLFTLFGMVNWTVPFSLHLGLLPLLYTITMYIQMSQQPKPADPMQARMMTYMPLFLLFVFNSMPSGLVLYWIWSNIISIVQQKIISVRHHAKQAKLVKA